MQDAHCRGACWQASQARHDQQGTTKSEVCAEGTRRTADSAAPMANDGARLS